MGTATPALREAACKIPALHPVDAPSTRARVVAEAREALNDLISARRAVDPRVVVVGVDACKRRGCGTGD